MRTLYGLVGIAFLLTSGSAYAQALAPVPKKSPRTAVKSQTLANAGKRIPASRTLTGAAKVIDTQTLSLQGFNIRLFGIVPPLLGASYGPQARAVMDSLTAGSTSCKILDRQRDGHYLARCHGASGNDYGLELLRRGLAVTARGTLKQTDVERNYIAAEQTAQQQRLGLWQLSIPKAASSKAIRDQATQMAQAQIKAAKAKAIEEAKKSADEKAKAEAPAPQTTISLADGVTKEAPTATDVKTETPKIPVEELSANDILAALSQPPLPEDSEQTVTATEPQSIWQKYQMLFTGLLLVFGAMVVMIASSIQRRTERKENAKSLAAAIRGELMAARSICKARLSKIDDQQSEADIAWPRLRTLVFQAHVGRIGELGAELSRQVASIYGQAADYAAYYRSVSGKDIASKRRALDVLVRHIDEVLPKLANIELSGMRPLPSSMPAALPSPQAKERLRLDATQHSSIPLPAGPHNTPKPSNTSEPSATPKPQVHTEAKKEGSAKLTKEFTEAKAALKKIKKEEKKPEAKKPRATAMIQEKKVVKKNSPKSKKKKKAKKQKEEKSSGMINLAAPIIQKLSDIKSKPHTPAYKSFGDIEVPDYDNLTEADVEALLSAEDEADKKVG